jgi:hypothetical protein
LAPHNPKSPIRKMRIPARIMIHAEISIDDNGKELKLNR